MGTVLSLCWRIYNERIIADITNWCLLVLQNMGGASLAWSINMIGFACAHLLHHNLMVGILPSIFGALIWRCKLVSIILTITLMRVQFLRLVFPVHFIKFYFVYIAKVPLGSNFFKLWKVQSNIRLHDWVPWIFAVWIFNNKVNQGTLLT